MKPRNPNKLIILQEGFLPKQKLAINNMWEKIVLPHLLKVNFLLSLAVNLDRVYYSKNQEKDNKWWNDPERERNQ